MVMQDASLAKSEAVVREVADSFLNYISFDESGDVDGDSFGAYQFIGGNCFSIIFRSFGWTFFT